jgi:hypothetical protein
MYELYLSMHFLVSCKMAYSDLCPTSRRMFQILVAKRNIHYTWSSYFSAILRHYMWFCILLSYLLLQLCCVLFVKNCKRVLFLYHFFVVLTSQNRNSRCTFLATTRRIREMIFSRLLRFVLIETLLLVADKMVYSVKQMDNCIEILCHFIYHRFLGP